MAREILLQNILVMNVEMSVKKEASLAKCLVFGTTGTYIVGCSISVTKCSQEM